MDDDLKEARSVAFSLQACGLRNHERRNNVELVCLAVGMGHRSKDLQGTVSIVRNRLGLKRSPVRHTGFELNDGAFYEAKVYIQTNVKAEKLTENGIDFTGTTLADEFLVLEEVCAHLKIDPLPHKSMLETVRTVAGLGLDMIGLDLRRDGRIELKLYFAPPEGEPGLAGNLGGQIAEHAVTALCHLMGSIPDKTLLSGMKQIMLAEPMLRLNQISTELQPSGLVKTKLYFDLWTRELISEAELSASKMSFDALRAIRAICAETGFSVPDEDQLDQFEKMAKDHDFELDAFCVENLGDQSKLKIYIRPKGNVNGDGLCWEAAQDDV
jgi:hypothetical protein